MLNLGLKTQFRGKFRGKIEIVSSHNFFSWKFADVWNTENLQFFAIPNFLINDAAGIQGSWNYVLMYVDNFVHNCLSSP